MYRLCSQGRIELQLNPSLRAEKTFGEFFEYWFVQKSQKKNAIRTQETYRDTFDNHLSEIKDVLFSFVSPHDIKRITDRLEKNSSSGRLSRFTLSPGFYIMMREK